MTEEQITKIMDLIKNFETADKITAITIAVAIIVGLGFAIWEMFRLKQLKKMHKEYLATLTEEQAKELERNKRYL